MLVRTDKMIELRSEKVHSAIALKALTYAPAQRHDTGMLPALPLNSPRTMRDPAVRAHRATLLSLPHVAPLSAPLAFAGPRRRVAASPLAVERWRPRAWSWYAPGAPSDGYSTEAVRI